MSKFEPEDPFDSLHTIIVCDVKDYSIRDRDAWIWGIIVGWDNESLKELQLKHKWSDDTVSRLKRLHERFKKRMEQ